MFKMDEGSLATQMSNLDISTSKNPVKKPKTFYGYTEKGLQQEVDKYTEKDAASKKDITFKDVAKFVAELTPVIGDAMAAKEVYDELQKDDPNYYLAGALGSAAIIGLVPSLGDAAASAIRAGARKTFDTVKRIEVDPTAVGSMGGNIRLKPKDDITQLNQEKIIDEVSEIESASNPKLVKVSKNKKTAKAYKLFKTNDKGDLYPLFVKMEDNKPIPKGKWIEAEEGSLNTKTGKVKSSIGDLAYRPGFHAGDLPIATHIGGKVDLKTGQRLKGSMPPNVREENQVWAEVEMLDEFDWQSVANKRARIKKDGTPDVKTAHITDQVPYGGFYRYKTNPNMTGNWLIGGELKVKKVLSSKEVKKINDKAGVADLPKLSDLGLKLNKGGTAMKNQMDMFADGGLKDDGTTKDPVSGNDVPSGSLAEEVRDDIPAQLSEGEYVIPADVVRFYGVKFFEDLRTDAKMGLANMERNGRIGGEPVAVAMIATSSKDEELSPEEEDMIKKITGAAKGGLMGYAPGGLQSQTEQQFLATQSTPSAALQGFQTVGQSLFGAPKSSGAASKASSPKTFYHPDGRIQVVQFINGSPQQGMEGFTVPPWSTNKPSDTTSDDDNEREDRPAKILDATLTDLNGNTVKMTQQNLDALKISAARVGKNTAEYYALPFATRIALLGQEFKKEGADSDEVEKIIKKTKDGFSLDSLLGFGKEIFKRTPIGIATSIIKSITDNFATSKEGETSTVTSTGKGKDKVYTSGATRVEADSTAGSTSKEAIDAAKKSLEGKTLNIGGRNKGGLLTKPKRKPKKPRGKGLASK